MKYNKEVKSQKPNTFRDAKKFKEPIKSENNIRILVKKKASIVLVHMQKFFSQRLNYLKNNLEKMLLDEKTAELLQTMQNDDTTKEYVGDRVYEIIHVMFILF